MDRIILQAQKDANKLSSRPRLVDTLSIKGFLRYLLYRNSMPFVRELTFLLMNVAEFALVLYFFGKHVGVGSAIAGVFLFFKNNLWRAFLFSLRDKILELKVLNKLDDIPKYFYSYVVLAIIYWIINIVAAYAFIDVRSVLGSQIFYHKLIAGIFILISSTYFISAYTLSRVYISLPYTMLNRFLNLVFIVAMFKYLGIYSFIISFYLTNIIDLLITLKYCKKVFVRNDVHFNLREQTKHILAVLSDIKNRIDSSNSIKRIVTFVAIYIQPLLIIFLVNKYYPDYLIEYYALSLITNLFFLIPNRIAKSMYYDLTFLIFNKNFSMLRNLFYKNLYFVIACAVLVTGFVYYAISDIGVPQKWTWLFLDLSMLENWKWFYLFIFMTFPLRLFSYLLMVSESFITLTIMTLVFDYLLLFILFINSTQSDNVLYLFFVKGKISLVYLASYIIIFMSGVWKKDSKLNKIVTDLSESLLVTKQDYVGKVEHISHLNPVISLLIFENKYTNAQSLQNICKRINEHFEPVAMTRISNNSVLVLNDPGHADIRELEFKYISNFGVFCSYLRVYNLADVKTVLMGKPGTPNFIINMAYPKLYSQDEDLVFDIDLNDSDANYNKIRLSHDTNELEAQIGRAKNKEGVSRLCQILANNDGIVPDNLILKKGFLGLIPIINRGNIDYIYEMTKPNAEQVKKILRKILYKEVYELCGGYWI